MQEPVPKYFTDFVQEQGKVNMMVFEQLQAINEKLTRLGIGDSSGTSSSGDKGKLPSKPISPHEEVKAIHTLRSGTQYSGPEMPVETDSGETEENMMNTGKPAGSSAAHSPENTNRTVANTYTEDPISNASSDNHQDKETETENDSIPSKDKGKATQTPPPYRPPVPFPQRLAKNRLDEQFAKFMEVLKQLTISIPFTDALLQMPSYSKFLKDILSNKRSLKDCKSVQLNLECNAVVSRELPPKLGDLGKC